SGSCATSATAVAVDVGSFLPGARTAVSVEDAGEPPQVAISEGKADEIPKRLHLVKARGPAPRHARTATPSGAAKPASADWAGRLPLHTALKPPNLFSHTVKGPIHMWEKRQIGHTKLQVTTLGLGTATMGGSRIRISQTEGQAIVTAAWDAGIRYVDTAPFYGVGAAEHRVGDALRDQDREAWVLSTKVGRLLRP